MVALPTAKYDAHEPRVSAHRRLCPVLTPALAPHFSPLATLHLAAIEEDALEHAVVATTRARLAQHPQEIVLL
eukprot:2643948-Prymnesium_polylepis.1